MSYRFKFLRLPTAQRRELFAADTFEPLPLHPAVQRQLKLVGSPVPTARARVRTPWGLFMYVLRQIPELVIETVLWNAAAALVVLGAVLLAREVFQAQASLSAGLALVGGYLVLKLLQAGIEYWNSCRRLQVHRGIQACLYRLVNDKLIHISPAGRANFSKGQLKTLVGSDVESIEDFMSAALQQWVPPLLSSLVILPALWAVSGWIGLAALASAVSLLPLAIGGSMLIEQLQKRAQREQDVLATAVGEWVKNIRLVRFLGWDRAIESEIDAKMGRYGALTALRHGLVTVVWAFSLSWTMVPLLVTFSLSSLQSSPLNLAEVFSSFWLLDHLMNQLQYIPHSLGMYGAACAGAHRVIELLKQPELDNSILPVVNELAIATGAQPTKLILRGATVSFGTSIAVNPITLSLSLHERTAIVGGVASGKTTLVEALVGELPLTSGSIDVEFDDGSRAPLWRRDAYERLRALVAYSPQQPFLSNSLMRNNIDLSGHASFEDVQAAVSMAQLSQDIALLPRGLNEEVGESGINLSGGQKQRVSLARAFLSKRPILVLDDPLSAVDSATERTLMDSILGCSQGLILVSHRLAELERCDRVIVLDGGRVIEDGAPKSLAQQQTSHFRRFLDALEEHGG